MRRDAAQVLTISANGYGKRTDLEEYRQQSRGGLGILAQKTTSKTGALVALKSVVGEDELMIGTEHGLLIRMPVAGISTYGRNAQGVRVIKLRDGDAIADVARLVTDGQDPDAATDGEVPDAPPAQAA